MHNSMNLERWGCLYIYIETVREWRCIKDNVSLWHEVLRIYWSTAVVTDCRTVCHLAETRLLYQTEHILYGTAWPTVTVHMC